MACRNECLVDSRKGLGERYDRNEWRNGVAMRRNRRRMLKEITEQQGEYYRYMIS
jgi:hypothetical protein